MKKTSLLFLFLLQSTLVLGLLDSTSIRNLELDALGFGYSSNSIAIDETQNVLYVLTNPGSTREFAVSAFNLQSLQLIGTVRFPEESIGKVNNKAAVGWVDQGLVVTDDGRLVGLFSNGSTSIFSTFKSKLVELPNLQRIQSQNAQIIELYSTQSNYSFLGFFNKKFFTLNVKYRHIAEIDPVRFGLFYSNRHFDHPELDKSFFGIFGVSVAPNGTLALFRDTPNDGYETLVFRLPDSGTKLELIQKIPVEFAQASRDPPTQILATNRSIFLGTLHGAIHSFEQKNSGSFESQQTVSLPNQTNIEQMAGHSTQFVALQQSGRAQELSVARLLEQPILVQKPPVIAEPISLAQKAAGVQQTVDRLKQAPSPALGISPPAEDLVIALSFDSVLSQKMTTPRENQGKQPFDIFKKNAVVKLKLNGAENPAVFLVQENRFVFPQLKTKSKTQSQTISIASQKISGYSGNGISIEIDLPEAVNTYNGTIPIELVAKGETA